MCKNRHQTIFWKSYFFTLQISNQKLLAFAKIVNYMDLGKCRILMKAFVLSQFNYCRLIWMFYSMQLNNRINKTNERAFHYVRITKNCHQNFGHLMLATANFPKASEFHLIWHVWKLRQTKFKFRFF